MMNWAISKGISFNALDGKEFRTWVNSLKAASNSYQPPARKRIANELLDRIYKKIREDEVDSHLKRSANLYKATIASDGMTYQKKPFSK